jgi:hypothetical protein
MKYRIIQTGDHAFHAQERENFFFRWRDIQGSYRYTFEDVEDIIKSIIEREKYIKAHKKIYPIIHNLKIK